MPDDSDHVGESDEDLQVNYVDLGEIADCCRSAADSTAQGLVDPNLEHDYNYDDVGGGGDGVEDGDVAD